ncbi:zinc ribbon domain-containing protein [Leucobacter sp. Z1108]|uniref:zinc ribbon domain-containing protein n=1 Tax=Leucobacter sp. Z1108 TaxID=3439066 RepID=UPI003F3E198B
MKASPRQQSLLLDLQDHDNLVARLRRKRTQLPERQELAALQGELSEAKTEFMAVQRELDAQNADISRLENDVETVRQRRRRDADLLSASTSSKEAQSLQGEIDTLEKRQGVLEERELDLMQASEETQARYDAASELLARVDERRAELTANLLEAERAIDAEIVAATEERAGIAAELQRDLLDLYENLRQRGGVGAARLRGNVSEGSNMALAPAELQEIRSAAPDELVFCPGSGAILIRVDADDPR